MEQIDFGTRPFGTTLASTSFDVVSTMVWACSVTLMTVLKASLPDDVQKSLVRA